MTGSGAGTAEGVRVDRPESGSGRWPALLSGATGRNLGLVLALLLLCAVGAITAGDRFVDFGNVMTVLRLASVIGVVSVGMTFVIAGGGIDLSVGAIVALASVWATTLATQRIATDYGWVVVVTTALAVGAACGLINGLLIAYGRIAPFIVTLAMLAGAAASPRCARESRRRASPCPGSSIPSPAGYWASRCW